jgi:hypothetical protein
MAHPSRIFKTEEEMAEAWAKFKENLKEQADEWKKVQYVGKDGDKREDPQKVPMTLEGFKRFCRENYGEIEQYFSNQDKYYDDFIGICSRIREEIRENQIIGGMLGFFNPSITQRLNGLTEKTESQINANISQITGMEIK